MSIEMKGDTHYEQFRQSGRLAFCPSCGSKKNSYRAKCKTCGFNPQSEDRALARSIMLSTEQYYLKSDDWKNRTPKDNIDFISSNLVQRLVYASEQLKSGMKDVFDPEEEVFWIRKIVREKKVKMPWSLGCFLAALYIISATIVVLFFKVFFGG
jgi:uncharacterized membrane protein YvbJ